MACMQDSWVLIHGTLLSESISTLQSYFGTQWLWYMKGEETFLNIRAFNETFYILDSVIVKVKVDFNSLMIIVYI